MTDDNIASIAADLIAYLNQQQEDGTRFVYGADPGEPPPALQAPPKRVGAKPAAKTAELPQQPAARPPATDDFAAACHAFVSATLKQIAAYGDTATAPPAADMFSAVGDSMRPMTLKDKTTALGEMAAEVGACTACKLHPDRTNTVFGSGNPDADLVLIGEAPGRDEDLQGLPFVGRSGKLLTDILKAIEFARDDVYICNILKCRPPQNRDPEADEVQACESFLKRQLAIIQPRVILCLGRHAAMTLLQTKASLGNLREAVHFYQGIPVMATFHPAALLRNPHWKRDTWDDVRKLRALHDALKGSRS